MKEALAYEGVALVDVRIDYSQAKDLAGNLLQDSVG
jgi:acetolactate synthase-1/2/3 large subunit